MVAGWQLGSRIPLSGRQGHLLNLQEVLRYVKPDMLKSSFGTPRACHAASNGTKAMPPVSADDLDAATSGPRSSGHGIQSQEALGEMAP